MIHAWEEKKEILEECLTQRRFQAARKVLLEMNAVDIADLLDALDEEQQPVAYRLLTKEIAADAFAYLEPETQETLIHAFTERELKTVMEELYADDMADLLEEMPASVAKRILRAASAEKRKEVNQLLQYPEDSAGSVMTTEFVDLKADMTVAEAFRYIRKNGPDTEAIYTCYVTDDNRHLQGVVSVKELLLAHENDRVDQRMETHVFSVSTLEDQEQVAQLFARYDLLALPVVDSEGRLVGIITVDDVVDILQQEATETVEKMAAITPTDKSYFRTGVWTTFCKRVPWLLLLMLSSTFTGIIITSFEKTLMKSVVLTAFIPMLMGTGGNSGSQASVTVIRSLALGDIRLRDALRVVIKESQVAFLCGAVLAVVNFLKMLVVDSWLLGVDVSAGVALVIAGTLLATVVIAKVVGGLLPLLAKRVGVDPAVMASPFITTIVDVVSLLVYIGFAQWILY